MSRKSVHAAWVGLFLAGAFANVLAADEVKYTTGDWPVEGWGNTRARVAVGAKAAAVWLHIDWRRRDQAPDRKDIIVVDAATKKRLANVLRVAVTRESGDLIFQPPTAPGEYFVYYMPYKTTGSWYFPTVIYQPPQDTASADWAATCAPAVTAIKAGKPCGLPPARLVEIQAINDFNRFDPMEVIATAAETRTLREAQPGAAFLLFPEDRRYPIRMTDDLPQRSIQAGPGRELTGLACRGEFYAFQIGLWACGQEAKEVAVEFSDLKAAGGGIVPASAIRCFNLGGTDWIGRPFKKSVTVPRGKVQALWLGVQVAKDAAPGEYHGAISVRAKDCPPRQVKLALTVLPKELPDAGDSDLWRMSRLRWLDSTIGLDDEVFAPYTPVQADGPVVSLLGRQVRLGDGGLPASIQSRFSASVDRADAQPREILAGPVRFVVETPSGPAEWKTQPPTLFSRASGAVVYASSSTAPGLELHCQAKLECDGYVNYELTLTLTQSGRLKDVRLEIPFRADVARYQTGMGFKGGKRPAQWDWRWNEAYSNNQIWIGDVNAGLQLKLKHVQPRWDLFNLKETGVYRDWGNGGKGGCTIRQDGDQVVLRAYTGERALAAGQRLHFNFGLLVTPVKVLDKAHWAWRYFHRGSAAPIEEIAKFGAKVVSLHQGDGYNPYINYPFLTGERLKPYIDAAHARGIKVKLYYTIRELSNYTAEFFALRSLGDEIFLRGDGFRLADQFSDKHARQQAKTGSSWLCEHAVTDYVPAWHQPLGNGHTDAAVATAGLSRWHNYYLQGLDWLVRNLGVDGLYLDGIGYDREIMKRVRKVMQRARPGCLIDFHCGNSFAPPYGMNNCACLFMELFPCIDSLWFGEGFNYNETPDYWLIEIAGVPYGLFGEMLGGGNPWRGMIYGMTNRLGWGGDPREIWKVWDSFAIAQARMIGYWDGACPVRTGREDVLATAYVNHGKTLVSIASWAPAPQMVTPEIDFKALGLDAAKAHLYAPPIKGFQPEALFEVGKPIPVPPGRGWLLVIDEQPRTLPPAVDLFAGLKPIFEDRFAGPKLDDAWKSSLSAKTGAKLTQESGAMVIAAKANAYALAERPLPPGVRMVACRVNQDSDGGASWGPGMCLVWKDGRSLRVNLRAEGRFGVDGGGRQIMEGSCVAQTWTDLVIRLSDKEVLVRASQDSRVWQDLARFPRSAFPGDPTAVRLGKMSLGLKAEDFSILGPLGRCEIKDLRAYK